MQDNIPVVSVADLTRRLKRTVESQTGREWVEGEIVSLKSASSGHVYFSLKDAREDACIECVMYRLDALRAPVRADGTGTGPRRTLSFAIGYHGCFD